MRFWFIILNLKYPKIVQFSKNYLNVRNILDKIIIKYIFLHIIFLY